MSKIISIMIAASILISSYFAGISIAHFMLLMIYLFFALSLIWSAESWGSYTGRMAHSTVDSPTPPVLVKLGGWLLLLLPIVQMIIIMFNMRRSS